MSTRRTTKPSKALKSPVRRPPQRPGPEGGVRAENRRRRVEELTSAACELFLARGLEEVTIDEIVQAAGVAKGSFYRYFDDKAALVEELFAETAGLVRAAFAACATALSAARSRGELEAAYTSLAVTLGGTLLARPKLTRLYLQECRGPGHGARAPVARLADEIRVAAVALTERAQEHGLVRRIDPRVSALAVIGASERLLFAYLAGEIRGSPEHVPRDLVSLVVEGIGAPAR